MAAITDAHVTHDEHRSEDEPASTGVPAEATQSVATAVGLASWALRIAPDLLLGTARLLLNPRRLSRRVRGHSRTAKVLGESLDGVFPGRNHVVPPPTLREVRRLVFSAKPNRIASGIPYGPLPGQELEVWRRPDLDVALKSAPVLVYVPGGGWVSGTTALQGNVLLGHFAEAGWVCVAVNYRAAPAHRWPAHLHDVKRALAWVHNSIASYGGDSSRIAVAGTSAGGHLASLAGLTAGDPIWQPGFEHEPTDVSSVIGLYGRYDWESRETPERRRFMAFLENIVVGARQDEAPDVFAAASPIRQVGAYAPPFFVIHGRSDAIIPVDQARAFVERLRQTSVSPVAYAELPGTGHGFDIVDPFRAAHAARAVELFLRNVH